MYLKIKKAKLIPAQYGSFNILISMVGLYHDDNKYIKRVKLDQKLIDYLLSNKIYADEKESIEDQIEKMIQEGLNNDEAKSREGDQKTNY